MKKSVPAANPDAYVCNQPGYIGFEDLPDATNLSSGAIGGVQQSTDHDDPGSAKPRNEARRDRRGPRQRCQ